MDATTVAVDVAKNAFEVVIANREWHILERHRFSRTRFLRFLHTAPRARVTLARYARLIGAPVRTARVMKSARVPLVIHIFAPSIT